MTNYSIPPVLNFTKNASLIDFDIPAKDFMYKNQTEFKYLATGAFIFDKSDKANKRILLIQRSSHDTMPNHWEVPGGGVDIEDSSILNAVAREVWEEAGLEVTNIEKVLDKPHIFSSSSGKRVGRYVFFVDVKSTDDQLNIRLDPEEHQNFVFATENEVKDNKAGDIQLKFTTETVRSQIIEAFNN